MYLKRLFIAAIILLSFFVAEAHNKNELSEIKMKSGEVIKAKIIEAIPDKYIKIEQSGEIRTIQLSEVENISSPKSDSDNSRIRYNLMAGVDVNYSISNAELNNTFLRGKSRNTSIGYGFTIVNGISKGKIDLGLGLGLWLQDVTNSFNSKSQLQYMIPIFLNSRFNLGENDKVKPAIELSLGMPLFLGDDFSVREDLNLSGRDYYSTTLSTKGLLFTSFSTGLNFKLSKKLWLYTDLMFRYTLCSQSVSSTIFSFGFSGTIPAEKNNIHLLQPGIKVGIRF